MQVEAVAMIAFALYRRVDITSGLLVFNTQIRLAQYRVVDDQWHDELSNCAVTIPGHFADLRSRITRDGWPS